MKDFPTYDYISLDWWIFCLFILQTVHFRTSAHAKPLSAHKQVSCFFPCVHFFFPKCVRQIVAPICCLFSGTKRGRENHDGLWIWSRIHLCRNLVAVCSKHLDERSLKCTCKSSHLCRGLQTRFPCSQAVWKLANSFPLSLYIHQIRLLLQRSLDNLNLRTLDFLCRSNRSNRRGNV